jgi:DNA replication and repair protein RecF
VQIEWLELTDFRSYRALSFAPGSSINILSGANGQGKTNVLEGLGVLLVGRSFRGARLGEQVGWGATAAMLGGEVRKGESARSIRRRIEVREDGRGALLGEGCPWVRAVPFAWQDLAVITAGPQARRNFLDGVAAKLYPAHGRAWSRYRQVLARRNHLLQSGIAPREMAARIDPWNAQLAQLGGEVRQRRVTALGALGREFSSLHGDLSGEVGVDLVYRPTGGTVDLDVAALQAAMEARLGDEIRRGQSLVGPHRDEIDILVAGRDARLFASRGQQRVLALALRLAEARAVATAIGSPPVLLLDDALSELDRRTQERVVQHIAGSGQVFLTTAEREVPVAGAAWWDVRGGRVTQATLTRIRGAA